MNHLRKLPVQWVVFVLGLGLSFVEAVVVQNRNLAVLILAVTVLTTVATLEIKKEIGDQIESDLRRIVERIHNKWKPDATLRVRSLEADLREWADGRRAVARDKSIPYQIALLQSSKSSVEAVHLALPVQKLDRWLVPEGHFGQLVAAHKQLGGNVQKKRILFLDDGEAELFAEGDGHRQFKNAKVVDFCRKQANEFGVELRALFLSDLVSTDTPTPPDLLIVDRREAVIISAIVDSVGKESFDTDAVLNQVRVQDYAATFEDLWNTAEPIDEYLPEAASNV